MNSFAFDGITFDLTHAWIDCLGGRWVWTGRVNEAGEPLMQAGTTEPLSLPDLHLSYGPLIPAPGKVTAAEAVQAVDVNYTASVTARLTESYADYVLRLGGAT